MRQQDIKALTGLRGAAALWVVLYHYSYEGTIGPRPARALLAHGYLAVDLFFVLSGFVMALTYAGALHAEPGLRTYGRFLARRLARIYPLYFVMTMVCLALACAGYNDFWHGGAARAGVVAANVLMLQSFGLSLSIDLPAWSISSECAAYLLFPLFCAVALFRGRRTACVTALVCAAALAALSLVPPGWSPDPRRGLAQAWLDISDGRTWFPLIRTFAGFTLGLLTWRAWQAGAADWLRGRIWPGLAATALLLALLCAHGMDTITVLLMPVLILCLASDASPPARLLASRPLEWLGLVSYSIYLVHNPVRDVMEYYAGAISPSRVVMTAAELAATLLLSWATYSLIERPGRHVLQRALGALGRRRPGFATQAARVRAGSP